MTQRQTLSGRRSTMAWFAIALVLVLVIITVAVIFIVAPQQRLQQQAQATVAARQVELEQAYGAGVAFEDAGDWEAAVEQFKLVIGLDANYKDASTRLTEVRNRLMLVQGTATAVAVAVARKTEADAVATAQIAPKATQQALDVQYEKGVGYVSLGRWLEAKAVLDQVFEIDPNYKEVQTKLREIEAEIPKLTPTATPTPLVTATPTPATTPISTLKPGSVLFDDDFNDGDAEGWVPAMGTWNVVEGGYVCVSHSDGRAFVGEDYWTDYIVSADTRPLSGIVDVSVIGRLQDAEHFYLGQLHRGNARIYRRNGRWIELASAPYTTTNGTWYEVKVEFLGTRINLYVNDVLVTSAEDAAYLQGKVGFRCASDSQAYFDNIVVWLPPIQ